MRTKNGKKSSKKSRKPLDKAIRGGGILLVTIQNLRRLYDEINRY